jgi:peptidoglycan/xylan/chitin deacetylase (PgdA/CDA1 family)
MPRAAMGKFGATAALGLTLLLAACGGESKPVAPAATEAPAGEVAPAAAAAQVISDAATRVPDPIPAAPAESVAPVAPALEQPAAPAQPPQDGAALPPIVVQPAGGETTAPPAPAPVETQPAAPTVAAAPVAEPTAVPAAPAAPETVAEGSEGMGGESAPVSMQPADGMSQLIEGGSNGRKEVALTFDAGADRGYAEAILDLLRDNGIIATFGMTGAWAEANPDLIQRMVAEGHQLINHTWSHDSLTGANTGKPAMTREQLADELARTENIIRELTGYELQPWFRPPYGDYDATTLTWLNELGYPYTAMWTCDTRGWAGWDARKIVDYCTSVPLEDDIILMHVGASAAGDYEALPELIQYYRDNGYAFVAVAKMLEP